MYTNSTIFVILIDINPEVQNSVVKHWTKDLSPLTKARLYEI